MREEKANFFRALQGSYDEIFEIALDADAVRTIHCDRSRYAIPAFSGRYGADARVRQAGITPDDREAFLAHYDPEDIRRRLKEDIRLELEYRLRAKDGAYRWMSSLLLPPCRASADGCSLILRKDIDARSAWRTADPPRTPPGAVLRQSGDCIIEIDMRTWRFTHNVSASHLGVEPREGDLREFYDQTLAILHPDDVERISASMSPEALDRSTPRSHCREITRPVPRVRFPAGLWLENRIFFPDRGEDGAVFVLRDISDRKRLEEERARERNASTSLRNTYTGKSTDRHPRRHTAPRLHKPDAPDPRGPRSPRRHPQRRRDALIHPEDRERFLATFIGSNIRKEFAAGRQEVPAEYRRLGDDGNWYWVASAIVPLCGHDTCRSDRAMLLVRDISEDKRQEQRRRSRDQYDHALRNIYDELYELNVTPRTPTASSYHVQEQST